MKAMTKIGKLLILIGLIIAVVVVIELKKSDTSNKELTTVTSSDSSEHHAMLELVEFGSKSCGPCRAMKPILDQISRDFAGRLNVRFVDVHKSEDQAEEFGIYIIPTQIFRDADGRELFRHEGFYSRKKIITKWKELGYDLEATEGDGP